MSVFICICILIGQIIFDATGQIDIQGLGEISNTLTDALVQLGEEQNVRQIM